MKAAIPPKTARILICSSRCSQPAWILGTLEVTDDKHGSHCSQMFPLFWKLCRQRVRSRDIEKRAKDREHWEQQMFAGACDGNRLGTGLGTLRTFTPPLS